MKQTQNKKNSNNKNNKTTPNIIQKDDPFLVMIDAYGFDRLSNITKYLTRPKSQKKLAT